MKLQKSFEAILIVTALAMGACTATPQSSPNVPLASAQGREAALQALKLPKGSMQQEKALLHMRATEHRIRLTGDSAAADAYIQAAKAVLDSAYSVSVRE